MIELKVDRDMSPPVLVYYEIDKVCVLNIYHALIINNNNKKQLTILILFVVLMYNVFLVVVYQPPPDGSMVTNIYLLICLSIVYLQSHKMTL